MVTAAQLQILQSPITSLISSISSSVNVKLDDSNYLNWNFQIQLLLESNGIFGFADGSHPCPASTADTGTNSSPSSSAIVECDELRIWKMHDRAVMQLITATLSPVALSCAIGSTSSKDLWQRLKEQFSTVSKTSIFQLKSNLQNIRNRGRVRPNFNQRSYPQRTSFQSKPPEFSPMNSGMSRSFFPGSFPSPVSSGVIVCQLCNMEGHTAPSCGIRGYERIKCSICGKPNHTNWYCYYNEAGPNFIGSSSNSPVPQSQQLGSQQIS